MSKVRHNHDDDGWCQNEGCMWNGLGYRGLDSEPDCPVRLPHRAATVDEQEEMLATQALSSAKGSGNTTEPLPSGEQPTSVEKVPWQALKLAGGCPNCGAETNQEYIDNLFLEVAREERRQAKIAEYESLIENVVPIGDQSYYRYAVPKETLVKRLAELKDTTEAGGDK